MDITKTSSRFSLEFRDADIKDVLRAVGQAANLNMIVSDTVTGQVSLSLKDVDIMDALESILKTKGLTYVRERNIVRVVAVADVRDDDMETRVFPLGYANGKDALVVVEKIKSEKAKVSVDTRINALVVRDLSLNIDRMERLLTDLDKRAPQIMIEAKIVEVSTNYAREFGVQWGGQYTGTSSRGTTKISGGVTGGIIGAGTPHGRRHHVLSPDRRYRSERQRLCREPAGRGGDRFGRRPGHLVRQAGRRAVARSSVVRHAGHGERQDPFEPQGPDAEQ